MTYQNIEELASENAKEILSLKEVKSYLKIDLDDSDEFLSDLIITVRQYAEKFLNFHFTRKSFRQLNLGNNIQNINIIHTPVISIKSLSVINNDQKNVQVSSDEYYFDHFNQISITKLAFLYNKVILLYEVGYKNSNFIPLPLKTGMLMHIASIYDSGNLSDPIPMPVLNLYQQYRRRNL